MISIYFIIQICNHLFSLALSGEAQARVHGYIRMHMPNFDNGLRHVVPRHQTEHSFPSLREGMLRPYSIRTAYARLVYPRIASPADLDLSKSTIQDLY